MALDAWGAAFGGSGRKASSAPLLLPGVTSLALVAYQCYLLGVRGQTIGKRIVGIRVVRHEDGSPAGFVNAALLRGIVNGIFCLLPGVGVAYYLVDMLFIFSKDERCLHDRLAGTKVVAA